MTKNESMLGNKKAIVFENDNLLYKHQLLIREPGEENVDDFKTLVRVIPDQDLLVVNSTVAAVFGVDVEII